VGRRFAAVVALAALVACGSDSASEDDGAIVASVDFEVTPTDIALGDVSCGGTKSSTITITNKGGATLTYNVALPDGSPFAVESPSGTLASGASATLTVNLQPDAAGDILDTATVDVNGVVQQVALHARGVGAVLVADPPLVDFGEVRFDRAFTQDVALRNIGNAPALVDGFEGGADAIAIGPSAVTIEAGASGAFVATVGAGTVTGAPTTASLTPTVAPSTPHCGPRPKVDVAATRVNTDVTLSVADFGPQPCGTGGGATRDVTITNYALQALTYAATLPAGSIFTLASPAQGTVPAATPTTAATAAVKIAMGATGTVLGLHEELLGLQIDPLAPPSGGARTTTVRLDVRGAIITATPTQLSFSSDGKKPDRQKVRFQNTGNEAITLRYSIDKPQGFTWGLDTNSQTITPTQARDVTVSFWPFTRFPPTYNATLVVANDPLSLTAVCSPLPQPMLQGQLR
jgi:hypothetical protein